MCSLWKYDKEITLIIINTKEITIKIGLNQTVITYTKTKEYIINYINKTIISYYTTIIITKVNKFIMLKVASINKKEKPTIIIINNLVK